MIDEKKLIEAITNGEYTTGNILLDMELEQFIKDFPKIVTAEMRFPTVQEMAKDVANRAMDEYIYNGKTLRQWVNEIQKYQWISCNERFPKDGDNRFYMCVVENHEEDPPMFCQYEEEYGFGFWHDIYNEYTLGFVDTEFKTNEELGYEKVIAWMPLPDPYRPNGK